MCLIAFEKQAEVAGVFTTSKCPSAPVDWCRKLLQRGKASCVVINSGNANAFTGKKGAEAVTMTAKAAANALSCNEKNVYLASTGVIGEPLDASGFGERLEMARAILKPGAWHDAAQAIMTTDTYPKLSFREFSVDGKSYKLNGIAKGSGMIAPRYGDNAVVSCDGFSG